MRLRTIGLISTLTLGLLVAASLAQTDPLCKLLIENGLITEAEFMQKLRAESGGYQAMVQKLNVGKNLTSVSKSNRFLEPPESN